jgi:hypothetical protein
MKKYNKNGNKGKDTPQQVTEGRDGGGIWRETPAPKPRTPKLNPEDIASLEMGVVSRAPRVVCL